MRAGARSRTRGSRILLCLLAGLALVVGAAAQQPATSGSQAGQNSPPAETPATLPVSQAATNLSATTSASQERASDTAKETADQAGVTKLGPGDLIEVNVYNVPELATKARVSNSSDVYLPLIDYVHVEGLTQEEAQTVIEKRLTGGGFVRNPHVTIFVDEAASQGVILLGEVNKPGIYPDVAEALRGNF
jgi:protein involved in polysaccharide export with SLBB domain